jgi:hypothetical protein
MSKPLRGMLIVLIAVPLASACGAASAELGESETRETITRLEQSKGRLFASSVEQRREALALYAPDYLNVAPGFDGGVKRTTLSELERAVPSWPELPPDAFRIDDVVLIPVGDGYVVSMRVSGSGVNGEPFSAWATSVWARRGGEWKTVFYQMTPM